MEEGGEGTDEAAEEEEPPRKKPKSAPTAPSPDEAWLGQTAAKLEAAYTDTHAGRLPEIVGDLERYLWDRSTEGTFISASSRRLICQRWFGVVVGDIWVRVKLLIVFEHPEPRARSARGGECAM